MKKIKLNLTGIFPFILALLILLIFIPINMIFLYSDKVFDLTPSGKYTLDPLTVEILNKYNNKEIEIFFLNTLFNLKNEPRALPLYHTLIELDKYDNIKVICFDPDKNVELAKSINPSSLFNVKNNDIFVKCGNTIKQIPNNHFFQTDANGIIEYAGENLIIGAISVCASGSLPTVYFLSGYGNDPYEKTLEDGSVIIDDCYSIYKNEIRINNYDVKELNLSTVDKFPDNAVIVYLVGPKKDITSSDYVKINEYLNNGGAISMILPPCDIEIRFENIEKLLEKFEISMNYNIVSESKKEWCLDNLKSEKDSHYFLVSYPAKKEETSEDLTTDINTLIYIDSQNKNLFFKKWGISNTRSFKAINISSETIEKAPIIENLPTAVSSGEYTTKSTAMGGDYVSKTCATKLSNCELVFGFYSYNKQTGAKLIAIGSDDMITDERVTDGVKCSRMLVKFTNTWLFDSDINMGIVNKFNSYDKMIFESGRKASYAIKLFITVPIIFGIAGIAVWVKRRYD